MVWIFNFGYSPWILSSANSFFVNLQNTIWSYHCKWNPVLEFSIYSEHILVSDWSVGKDRPPIGQSVKIDLWLVSRQRSASYWSVAKDLPLIGQSPKIGLLLVSCQRSASYWSVAKDQSLIGQSDLYSEPWTNLFSSSSSWSGNS